VAVRDLDSERSEIVTLSWWSDTEAIKAFAGRTTGARAISPRTTAPAYAPEHVRHYQATVPGSAQAAH